ncbi:extracellular solute-binding protein [candidate division KSB1 bacterium]|nr:extracellular solute-binding protein [candidate division KSB1 bacterium]
MYRFIDFPQNLLLKCCMMLIIILSPPAFSDSQGKIKLHVWGMHMGEARFGWYAQIEAFERMYPNVEIVIGPTDRGEDLQKLLSGVVGDSPPDVFRRESQLFGDIAARGILLPLEDFIEADKARPDGIHEEDYSPGVWQSGFYNGKMYGIAESSNPIVLAYNRKIFRDAGLDPDKPPRTWDEWLEVTRTLTLRDSSGRIIRLGTNFYNRDRLSFYMAQLGGNIFSEDGRKCQMNSPEAIDAMTFLKALYEANGGRENYNRFVATNISPEELDPFGIGKIAMSVEDDWVIYRIMRYNPQTELGIAPIPAPEGRPHITSSGTNTLYFIPVNARHPKEAWDFIRFISSPEGILIKQDAIHAHAIKKGESASYPGFRANRMVMAALSAKYAPKDPLLRQCFIKCGEILENLVPQPISPVTAVLRDEMLRANDLVSYGDATVEDALNASNSRVQQQLDIYWARENLPHLNWAAVWSILIIVVFAAVVVIYKRTSGQRAVSALQKHENKMGLLFISPWIMGLLIFTAGPMVFSIAISFSDYDVIHPARFSGLANYKSLLFEDPLFWKSLRNTAFMVFALPIGMTASLSIALLLNAKIRGISVYRTLFYLPAITPAIATAVLWYALLNPDGLINAALNATIGNWFGVAAPSWLQDPNWSKPAMILMGIWGAGGGMILWLAGLQGIPSQLYEAAEIDGAGPVRRFWSITLPMLTPYIFFSLIVGIIGVFQIFAQALVLTGGGPADSTLFYVYYLFNNAFRYFKMGYASAQAWLLFMVILVLTLLQWKISKKWVHYG